MAKGKKVVQNQKPDFEDIQPEINQQIVNIVRDIFDSIIKLNDLESIFADLSKRLIEDLRVNSFMENDLELTDLQKDQLHIAIETKGIETVQNYIANLDKGLHTKLVYGLVREKTTEIVDIILSTIGQEINRGAIINAKAVQANSKNEKYDEILLRKTKASGDITVPTNVILISTNCMEVIKASCQTEKEGKGK